MSAKPRSTGVADWHESRTVQGPQGAIKSSLADAEAGGWLTERTAVAATEWIGTRLRPGHDLCWEPAGSDKHLEPSFGLRWP
ncbi:hypothetical protein NDU88_001187 [Pleurodeles waltl]|uniref:Uncharacterized protein n=1 Tax=Pleurodeles waltl TaxID=8319 RepID=A0AAV7MK75_PLEWA|nr:hypothetical protein NDU88_001187 [Pleurodeles waltl]